MNGLLLDLRYACRTLAKNRAFTAVAVLSLTIAIGANATIFCWIQNLVRHPLARVEDSDRVVTLSRVRGAALSETLSYPELGDYAALTNVFSGVTAFQMGWAMVKTGRESDWLVGQIVSGSFFDVLGIKPALGRVFTPDDDRKPGGHPVAVISNGYWKRRFGGSPSVIGKSIELNRHAFTIVGVAPAGFVGALAGLRCDLWAPMMMHNEVAGIGTLDNRTDWWIFVLGRLRPNVGLAQAQASVNVVSQRLSREYPASNAGVGVRVTSLSHAPYGAPVVILPLVPILLAVGLGVLLIVSANVANLLLARATGRRQEIAIRLAVGAGRRCIVRQLLVESLLLSALGGAGGVLFATWTSSLMDVLTPKSNMPIGMTMELDGQVLALTALVTLVSGLLFGLVPALQATRANVGDPLKGARGVSAGSAHRLRSGLVVGEIALTFVLLAGAGLCLKGFERAKRVDIGFNPANLLTMDLSINASGYTDETARPFYRDVLAHTRAVPGIASAALTGYLPLGFRGPARTPVNVHGYLPARGEEMNIRYTIVSPGFFDTIRMPLRGRDFAESDDEKRELVTIVNEGFAKRFWPGQEAIGRTFTVWSTTPQWASVVKVVGVAKTGKYGSLTEPPQPMVYLPYTQRIVDLNLGLVVRAAAGDPAALTEPVRGAIHAVDAAVEPMSAVTMHEHMQAVFLGYRFATTALAVLGGAALLLALIGIYGVMAFVVGQRQRELAIRVALGAGPRTIVAMVLRQGLSVAGIGVVVGLAGATMVAPALSALLFGLSPLDPATYLLVIGVVVVAAVAACGLPARRATRADPIAMLRCE